MFKKLKNYKFYKSRIKSIEDELKDHFNIKIDWINRLYTVFSIPYDEYHLYGDKLLNSQMNLYLKKLDGFLIKENLTDLYGVAIKEKVEDNKVKIVIRFKEIDTLWWANFFTIGTIITIISAIVSAIYFIF